MGYKRVNPLEYFGLALGYSGQYFVPVVCSFMGLEMHEKPKDAEIEKAKYQGKHAHTEHDRLFRIHLF